MVETKETRVSFAPRGLGMRFFDAVSRRGGNVVIASPVATGNIPGVYLLGDPGDIRRMFSDEGALDKEGFFYEAREEFADGLPTMATSDAWRRHQRIVAPKLVPHRVNDLSNLIVDGTKHAMDTWFFEGHEAGKLGIRDVYASSKTLDLQLMIKALIGVDASPADARLLADAYSVGGDFFKKNVFTLGAFYKAAKHYPQMLARAHDRFSVMRQFAERSLSTKTEPGTLVDTLSTAVRDGTLTPKEAIGEFVQTLAASFGTTANTIAWVMAYLGRPENHALQARIRQEVKNQPATEPPGKDSLLYASFLEVLRLRPPIHTTARRVMKPFDCEISGKRRTLAPGSMVLTSFYIAHHLPNVWEHPERFDPERFAVDRFDKPQQNAFIPFGLGKRSCSGRNLALHVGPQIVGTILRDYELVDKAKDASGVSFGATCKPSRAIHLEAMRVAS